jgi:hypothetical protein
VTDEQLNQRFTQIAQAFAHILEASDQHAAEMADIRKAQAAFADNDRKLQARIEAIAEETSNNAKLVAETSKAIANLEKQWQAYVSRMPRQ